MVGRVSINLFENDSFTKVSGAGAPVALDGWCLFQLANSNAGLVGLACWSEVVEQHDMCQDAWFVPHPPKCAPPPCRPMP